MWSYHHEYANVSVVENLQAEEETTRGDVERVYSEEQSKIQPYETFRVRLLKVLNGKPLLLPPVIVTNNKRLSSSEFVSVKRMLLHSKMSLFKAFYTHH